MHQQSVAGDFQPVLGAVGGEDDGEPVIRPQPVQRDDDPRLRDDRRPPLTKLITCLCPLIKTGPRFALGFPYRVKRAIRHPSPHADIT